MDGLHLWRLAGETTSTGDKRMKRGKSASLRVNECVQVCACVDFCPCESWKAKEKGAMIST